MTSDDNTPAVKAFVEHCALVYALNALRRRNTSDVLLRLARHPNSRVKSFIVTRRALELVAETLPIVATGGCALESRFPSLGAEGAW